MSKDPRYAKTLDEACSNGDGTFNGIKLLSWLSECLYKGKGVPEEEVRKIYNRIMEKKRREQRTRS